MSENYKIYRMPAEGMGLFDFWKKKESIPQSVVQSEVVKEETTQSLRDPYHTDAARELILSLPMDLKELRLDDIERNAETVVNYLRALMKDLVMYTESKGVVQERYKQNITTKVKLIAQRGLEVRNLIAQVEAHYFRVLLDALEKLEPLTMDHFLIETKKRLEQDVQMEKEIESKLLKVIAYDELLNAEKNPNVAEELARVAQAREINKDITVLLKMLNENILEKRNGLLARIRQERIVEALRIKATV